VDSLQQRPERGRAMAVVVGGEHWQSRAKRAAATAAAPCPASAGRAQVKQHARKQTHRHSKPAGSWHRQAMFVASMWPATRATVSSTRAPLLRCATRRRPLAVLTRALTGTLRRGRRSFSLLNPQEDLQKP
jgi:hypothetical protein